MKTTYVASEEEILKRLAEPISLRQLLKALKLPARQRQDLSRILSLLETQGRIKRSKGGLLVVARAETAIIGRVSQPRAEYAFIVPETEGQPDIYVPAEELHGALPNDRVSARVVKKDREGRSQGRVLAVLERGYTRLVGTFRLAKGHGLLKPDSPRFYPEMVIPSDHIGEATPGDKVVATITSWPDGLLAGRARVVEVLGRPGQEPGLDITLIVKKYELPETFSERAFVQAQQAAVEPGPAEVAGRLDLRAQRIVTIDGEDARDFDDAVFCEVRPEGGWRLGVHIADVSHYIPESSHLDLEARERGTSVYLPGRVLHMLPDPLSTGVCSLMPDRDRLTVSAFMDIEPDGKVSRTEFGRSVIHSAGRLTYNQVEEVLQGREEDHNPAAAFSTELQHLHQVSLALRRQREARGSVDFDLPEAKVILGPEGRVTNIERRQQLASHRLIEDCMVAANEAVATYLNRTDTPALYRVHDIPSGEKLKELLEFLEAYGYHLEAFKPRQASRVYQKLLAAWQGKPEAAVLNMALLRSMKLAVYAPKNIGHFGLASQCYAHFTSPIRRYPDLVVHRSLTSRLAGPLSAERLHWLRERMPVWGEQLSKLERRAEKAEREAVRIKQAEFMADKVGQIFAGTISSVTNFGFFVELDEQFVEGLVRVNTLPRDYYVFEERKRYWRGERGHLEFKFGDKVKVKVSRVERESGDIDFVLAEAAVAVRAQAPGRRQPGRGTYFPKRRRR